MKSKIKRFALMLASSPALAAVPANAANSFYSPGDLVLYFQQEGGSNTVYANLGNAALLYRGSSAGTAGDNGLTRTNILDLSSTLTSAFGANWATQSTIYAGLAGVYEFDSTNSVAVVDGDPYRTIYVSAGRDNVGIVGEASSAGYTVNTNTGMTNGATAIFAQNNAFATKYDALTTVSPNAESLVDDYNTFLAPGIQGTAFNIFGGGVQQQGSAGTFGTFDNFESLGDVEFALDLYRILGRTGVAGQVGNDLRQGTFEGTVTIGTNGQVSFLVPEPSSLAMAGLAAGALFMRRRRA